MLPLLFSLAQASEVVLNPYAEVDWATAERHQASLHMHTTESDGALSPGAVVKRYAEAGYTILSITDHDTLGNPEPTWPMSAYDIDPAHLEGVVAIQGNEISRPDHHGSYFSDYGDPEQRSVSDSLHEIGKRDVLAVMFHPGKYRDRRDLDFYLNIYQRFNHLIGMEVYNRNDDFPLASGLYDALLSQLMPQRPVWSYGNDDFHRLEHFGFALTVFLIAPEEFHVQGVRKAMEQGHHMAVYVPSTDASDALIPEDLVFSADAIEVVADANDSQVHWVSHGQVVHRGKKLPLSQNLGHYVRAVLHGANGALTHLQPIGLSGGEAMQSTQVSIEGGSGSGTYITGAQAVAIEATALNDEGEVFSHWEGDVEHLADINAGNTTLALPGTDPVTLKAQYRPAVAYALEVVNGTGSAEVLELREQRIEARVPTGMHFDYWAGGDEWVTNRWDPVTTITMPSRDVRMEAQFIEAITLSDLLINGDFSDGLEGWSMDRTPARLEEDAEGNPIAILTRQTGMQQRLSAAKIAPGTRLTLYFEARLTGEGNRVNGFAGFQSADADGGELERQTVFYSDREWTPHALSLLSCDDADSYNIFIWHRDGEMELRNFRLRVH